MIGNYDVKRCYILDVIFKYRIPGGLTVNTTRDVTQEFQSLFLTVYNLYLSLQQCKEVIVTIGNITSSPPGVSLVYFRVPLTFTASNNIADDLVAINVTTCVNAANVSLKGYIDRSAPNITQNKTTYQINQPSSLEKKSCCGGDKPPPCCAVGSIKVSNTSCGKDFHFYFERNKHSINKMIHTVCAAVFALKASAENSQQCPRPFISLLDTGQNLFFFFFPPTFYTNCVTFFRLFAWISLRHRPFVCSLSF